MNEVILLLLNKLFDKSLVIQNININRYNRIILSFSKKIN